ncbi:MAG TPA: type VI secretion system accessory protein TagJ [Paracoccaceae bacterium]|nr:type VI secretion system accessory protein TagJ [Paracoccaceae bacterium]
MSRREAEAALAAGDLSAAGAKLIEAVRAAPGDAGLRAFLFEVSALAGNGERAMKALELLGRLRPDSLDMTTDYQAALAAETTRDRVFAGAERPDVFGGARAWTDGLAEALALDSTGDAAAAFEARAAALDAAPASPGTVDGERFEWFADADTRLGPVLEAVINGAYRWIPFEEIGALEIEPPKDLRDLVWSVGVLTLADGGQWPVLIPTRYPGSEKAGAEIALARRTEWRPLGPEELGHAAGLGQRLFAHAEADVPILELRSLVFDHAADADEADAAQDPTAEG